MPVPFLAHQVPVLPLKMRRPDRWDGLALVVGSMVPDFWYVTVGFDHGWGGHSFVVNAHGWFQPLRWILPSMLVVWAVRHIVAPVVPLAFPDAGRWHLRDYRLLASAHHRWWVTAYSAFVGAFSHVLLDSVTHRDGYFVTNYSIMERWWFTIDGWRVKTWWLAQYVGSVVLCAAALWMVWSIGRRRLMVRWHGGDAAPTAGDLTRWGARKVRMTLAVSVIVGAAVGVPRYRVTLATAAMTTTLIVLAGAVVAGWWAQRDVVAREAAPDSPTPVDPLL